MDWATVISLAMEGLRVRAIARVLNISLTTVIKHLKKLNPPQQLEFPVHAEKPTLILQIDAQWSYIGSKKQQC